MRYTLSMSNGTIRSAPRPMPLPTRPPAMPARPAPVAPAPPDDAGDAVGVLVALGVRQCDARTLVARGVAAGITGDALVPWCCQRRMS